MWPLYVGTAAIASYYLIGWLYNEWKDRKLNKYRYNNESR